MLDFILISRSRRLMIIFKFFKIVLGPMSGTQLLQHSKLNCTVLWTMIASGLLYFIMSVRWNFFFHF